MLAGALWQFWCGDEARREVVPRVDVNTRQEALHRAVALDDKFEEQEVFETASHVGRFVAAVCVLLCALLLLRQAKPKSRYCHALRKPTLGPQRSEGTSTKLEDQSDVIEIVPVVRAQSNTPSKHSTDLGDAKPTQGLCP